MTKIRLPEEYYDESHILWKGFRKIMEKSGRSIKRWFIKLIHSDYETRVINIILNIPGMVFVLFLGFLFVSFVINYTEPEKGIRVANILTTSMKPSIKPGSEIVSVPYNDYEIGDIVIYKERSVKNDVYTGRILAHRIIDEVERENEKYYVAKGDANDAPDPGRIIYVDILGKVVLIIPLIGYVNFLISKFPGFLLFILFPTYLIIRSEIGHLKKI